MDGQADSRVQATTASADKSDSQTPITEPPTSDIKVSLLGKKPFLYYSLIVFTYERTGANKRGKHGKMQKRSQVIDERAKDGSEAGTKKKSVDPETCDRCGVTRGHKPDCAYRYRSCWTFGMRKGGVDPPGG